MDEPDIQIHSFVIRLWLEEIEQQIGQPLWRGHITHVATGEQCYVRDLQGINDFIGKYVEAIGVQFGVVWRIKRWWRRFPKKLF